MTSAPAHTTAQLRWHAAHRFAFALTPAVILCIPFLDFPGVGGGAYVKPLALPAVLMAFVLLFARTGWAPPPLQRFDKMWLAVLAWAIAGDCILPWMISMPHEMKGQTLSGRVLRDMGALVAGMMVWTWFRIALRQGVEVVAALRWVLLSFFVVMPFVAVQSLVVVTDSSIAHAADAALALLRSATQSDHYRKIFGTAPEASMLADQVLSLWMPFALASVLLGTTLFRIRPLGLRVEIWVVVLGLATLLFSQSRIGLVALVFLAVVGWLMAMRANRRRRRRGTALAMPLFALVVVAGVVSAGGNKLQSFVGSFGLVDSSIDNGVWSNVTRLATMSAGLDMAWHHPLGVGTGAYPFLFEQSVPDWALIDPEIQGLLGGSSEYVELLTGFEGDDLDTRLPDAKALPVRAIAELGIPGFAALLAIWLGMLRGCWRTFAQTEPGAPVRTAAFGVMLSLIVMLPLSFSINSYVWVHWILVAAMAAALWKPGPRHVRRKRPRAQALSHSSQPT